MADEILLAHNRLYYKWSRWINTKILNEAKYFQKNGIKINDEEKSENAIDEADNPLQQ